MRTIYARANATQLKQALFDITISLTKHVQIASRPSPR